MSQFCQVFEESDGLRTEIIYKVNHIFTKENAHIYKGKRICELVHSTENNEKKTTVIKSKYGGVVSKLFIKLTDDVIIGQKFLEVEACTHPTILGNICCDCGIVLEDSSREFDDSKTNGLVSMLHSIPDLKVSKEEAKRLGTEDIKHLLDNHKLVLLVDLDQTLIHTTNDNVPPKLKDVFHFQLVSNGPWYHTRLRPYATKFLQNISKYYELHICTFGVREYAHCIARFLDEDHKLFGDRILSRNECLDPMSKKANLSSLFPCGDNLVCIIDDRSDVWNFAPNVVQVMPYHFFQHTGDINAPPELQKKENDVSKGYDFTKMAFTDSKAQEYVSTEEQRETEHSKQIMEQESSASPDNKGGAETSHSGELKRKRNNNDEDLAKKRNKSGTSDSPSSEETRAVDEEEENNEKSETQNIETDSLSTNTKAKQSQQNQAESSETAVKESKTSKHNEPSDDQSEKQCSMKDQEVADKPEAYSDKDSSEIVDVEDTDDYLLYLEDILRRLHKRFYASYRDAEHLPDLKELVPKERSKVLQGTHLVFSGVIPQKMKLEESKAYHLATSLGATVSEKVVGKVKGESKTSSDSNNYTTHLVAATLHTEKVHQVKNVKNIKIVTPNWLWSCAERWEKVDERLFVLTNESEKTICRNPPIHCCINVKIETDVKMDIVSEPEVKVPSRVSRTQSLIETVNPLAYLSDDDAKSMEQEVDGELCDDEDDDDDDGAKDCERETDSSDSDESGMGNSPKTHTETDDDYDDEDRHRKQKRRHSAVGGDDDDEVGDEEDEEEELPSIRFRRGGTLSSEESDDDDDDDMNAYGDILEKELMD